jgi:hypothetical protein
MKRPVLAVCVTLSLCRVVEGAERPSLAAPLLASWNFDETTQGACVDATGNGHPAESQGTAVFGRVPGIHGQALRLTGRHALRLRKPLPLDGLSGLSIAVWVLPGEVGRDAAIYHREAKEQRVFFLVRNGGCSLDFCANIGGYQEFTAKFDATRLLDGRWHHCAATFDGHTVRLYLDGTELKAFPRAGKIAAKCSEPGFVGCYYGTSGRFEGLIDELQVYSVGLTAAQVAQLYEAGKTAAETYTGDLTAEALAVSIEADWLDQAGETPLRERAGDEISWARELAQRVGHSNVRAEDLDTLQSLEKRAAALSPDNAEAAEDLYLAVRGVKRRIMFCHPALDFNSVLCIDQPYPRGSEPDHQTRHRLGHMAQFGGQLLIIENVTGVPVARVLAPAPKRRAAFWRPDLSFDARKALFCMKVGEEGDQASFHLFEINLDGTGLRQLTSSDYDDLDPIYLPNGKIMFSTSRGNTYIRCMPESNAYPLARCDADGRNIYIVSRNNECDWLPTLLDDGSVIYSRWEYTDRALWHIQSLWTTAQDGARTAVFYGNQSVKPDHLAQPRPIPGSRRVMFTAVGHHGWFKGSVGIIDPAHGFNYPAGLTRVTWEMPWPEVGGGGLDRPECDDYHAPGVPYNYQTPYPLSDDLFLVSAYAYAGCDEKERQRAMKNVKVAHEGRLFALYLMDTRGNRELLYRGRHNIWHAMPVRPRSYPATPDLAAWPDLDEPDERPVPGILYSPNVYEGSGIEPGSVKALRVIESDNKTYSTVRRENWTQGPSVSYLNAEAVKRILGTVPVAADGSVAFRLPPGKTVHFQLLDEHGRAIMSMGSFTGVMPGEVRGCLGCHATASGAPVALARLGTYQVKDLKPPPWGSQETISYPRFVHPVLKKHCGACHLSGGKGVKALDLTWNPDTDKGTFRCAPYDALIAGGGKNVAGVRDVRGKGEEAHRTMEPREFYSTASVLIQHAMSGEHHKVKVTGEDRQRLIAWVDCNGPFRGLQEIREIPDNHRGQGLVPYLTATAPAIDRFRLAQDRKRESP